MIQRQSALCCYVAFFWGVELRKYLFFSSAIVNLYNFCMYVSTDASSNNIFIIPSEERNRDIVPRIDNSEVSLHYSP
jgi:hypothetical protein